MTDYRYAGPAVIVFGKDRFTMFVQPIQVHIVLGSLRFEVGNYFSLE